MDPVDTQKEQVLEVARIHDNNGGCAGLPFCVSCRAVALLKCDLNPVMAEHYISQKPKGAVLLLYRKPQ